MFKAKGVKAQCNGRFFIGLLHFFIVMDLMDKRISFTFNLFSTGIFSKMNRLRGRSVSLSVLFWRAKVGLLGLALAHHGGA